MENPEKVESLTLESAQSTDQGRKRSNNEDWVAGFEPVNPDEIQSSGALYIVADGVGGASRGERASRYAAERVLFDFFQEPNTDPAARLQNGMRKACSGIFEYAQESDLSRMATTMVAANIRGNVLTVANVGDSRCYLIRSGKVVQITQDHNMAAELVRNGSLTAEAAKHTKSGNTLLRSLGGEPDVEVDIFGEIDLYPGDIILLCSDGLTRYAENEDLLRFCADGTAEQMAQRLIDFANNSGGADNVSVYVIKVGTGLAIRDLDDAKTLPVPITLDKGRGKNPTRQKSVPGITKKPLNRGQIVNIGLSGVLLMVVIFGTVYLTNRNKNAPASPELTSTATPGTALPVFPLGEPTSSTPSEISAEPTGDLPLGQPGTALPGDSTQTAAPTVTVTQPPQQTPTIAPVDSFCVHEQQPNEFLETVFQQFSLNYYDYDEFFRYPSCNTLQSVCSGQREVIDDPALVQPGWFIYIPEVNEETCGSVEKSYWISVNP